MTGVVLIVAVIRYLFISITTAFEKWWNKTKGRP